MKRQDLSLSDICIKMLEELKLKLGVSKSDIARRAIERFYKEEIKNG